MSMASKGGGRGGDQWPLEGEIMVVEHDAKRLL